MTQNRTLTRRNFLLRLSAGLLASSSFVTSLWAASKTRLTGAKLSGKSDALIVAFMLDAPVKYKIFTLKSPHRVVIDLLDTELDGNLKQGSHDRPPIKGIRYANRPDGFRIVLDVTHELKVDAILSQDAGRYVLTLKLQDRAGSTGEAVTIQKASATSVAARVSEPSRALSAPSKRARHKKFVVAIDPGHGGHDPGAIGRRGTKEKDVVLAVARKLRARINATPTMRAVLTRNTDRFVPLRERMGIARNSKADLFISIHADANASSKVHGSSVYILSDNGASSEAAALLAKSDNMAYQLRVGDVELSGRDSKIASILLDLSQNATMDRSLDLANRTLRELSAVNNPLRRRVESASFVVLKAPDVPSMLVETAFLSNPHEEKRLRTPAYQQRLADAIFRGVSSYKQAHAPSGSMNFAATSADYIVRSGDSLSMIAKQYGVSINAIKRVNQLNSTQIRVGQKLRIPSTNT